MQGDLLVDWQYLLESFLLFLLDLLTLRRVDGDPLCGELLILSGESGERGVQPCGRLHHGLVPEFDLHRPGGLQHAAATLTVGIHLHVLGVDTGVHHHPGAPAELRLGRDVHEARLPEVHQRVHNIGTELQHLFKHVPLSAREAAPVGEDHQRQLLLVDVGYALCRLVRAVGVPHLSGPGEFDLRGGGHGGVGGVGVFCHSGLHTDHPHRDAAQTSTAHND
mmetsp:Transcript_25199/g.62412  ORF Transcript_25199/g.62412 Transcript_25199/m.62412 type:complete len:221 (+) Transcript_25199:3771-4433(+)